MNGICGYTCSWVCYLYLEKFHFFVLSCLSLLAILKVWWSFNVNENHFIANRIYFIFHHVPMIMFAFFPRNCSCCKFKGHFRGFASMNFVFEKNKKNFIYSPLPLNFAFPFWPKGFNAFKTGNKQKDKSLHDLLVFEKNNGIDAKEFSLAQRYTFLRPV